MAIDLHAQLVADAGGVLDRADVPHGRVVSVDRDSILFCDEHGCRFGVFTAWLNGTSVFLVEDGFVATEPAGLHARRVATNYGTVGGTV